MVRQIYTYSKYIYFLGGIQGIYSYLRSYNFYAKQFNYNIQFISITIELIQNTKYQQLFSCYISKPKHTTYMQPQNQQNINPYPDQPQDIAVDNQLGIVRPQQAMALKQRHERRLKSNIQRVLTPIQKLQSIPMLRLDQGVISTLKEQFTAMFVKLSYVLVPRSDSNASSLRNWDLWGPFLMVVLFAFFVDSSEQLLLLFFSIFFGAFIVTFNVVALGGKVSFFQSFAILSYCIFPIFLSLMLQRLLRFFQLRSRAFSVIFLAITVLWAIISVSVFIGVNVPENKKFIAIFPAALYYIFIGILLAFN